MPTAATVVLPYVVLQEYLDSHPLVIDTRCEPRNVYDGIVSMLSVSRRNRDVARARPPPTTSQLPPACRHCKDPASYILVDTATAENVCSLCGVTERTILEDNCMPYEKDRDDAPRGQCFVRPSIPGVPDWVQKSIDDHSETALWKLRSDMENFNPPQRGGPNYNSATLRELSALAAEAIPRATALERAVSALLYRHVESSIDVDDVRKRVSEGKPLPKMAEWAPKKLEYSCARCGAAVDTPFAAKRHPCRWGKTSRKRPRV